MIERIGLVGCVKTKLPRPAPAQDLYTSALFGVRRRYVERTCSRWFILSAKHGLVDPSEVLDPYDVTLDDANPHERRAWSKSVLDELRRKLGDLSNYVFEMHAGRIYLDFGLEEGLRFRGARVDCPAKGLGLFEQTAFYSTGYRPATKAGEPSERRERGRGHQASQMGRYAPLSEFLARQSGVSMEMRFDAVEALVGELPSSAMNHRAWWANDRSHSQARSWLDVGWRVSLADLGARRVAFARDQ